MKPECVGDYNAFMHGVDSADQYLALYSFMRKNSEVAKEGISFTC
jgi:hypothetical protein